MVVLFMVAGHRHGACRSPLEPGPRLLAGDMAALAVPEFVAEG